MTSRIQSVRFREHAPQRDSLVLSLDAILRAYGADVDIAALARALDPARESDSAASGRASRAPEIERHARNIVEAARRWGLELRDLHPPDAAPLPVTPPEFEQHFRDSYMPFIRASLDRDEPVLAWMGWPAPDERAWGIITGIDAESGRCTGRTASRPDRQLIMIQSPVQIYTPIQFAQALST